MATRYSETYKREIRGNDCCGFWRAEDGGVCVGWPREDKHECLANEDGTGCPMFPTYEERHQKDLAHGRMIWVRMPDGPLCHHYTMAEFEEARKAFNKKAIEVQKETGADHVLYGYKEYNEDGTIKTAGLDIIPLDDEEFHRRADSVTNYMIYAVHKH